MRACSGWRSKIDVKQESPLRRKRAIEMVTPDYKSMEDGRLLMDEPTEGDETYRLELNINGTWCMCAVLPQVQI